MSTPPPPTTPSFVSRSSRSGRGVKSVIVAVFAVLVLIPSLAPATVAEQRARLPPPAVCQDPVEGIWMSHKFDPRYRDWYIFTLRIRRAAPESPELTGDMQAHSWDGNERDAQPPPCHPGMDHWTVFMTAQGRAGPAGRIEFWGTEWRPDQVFCGRAPRRGEYYLDHFSGTIDPSLQEFQSVNNDGGRSINDPTVFRRVRCFDPPAVPHVTVAPPPFQLPRRSAGCGRS